MGGVGERQGINSLGPLSMICSSRSSALLAPLSMEFPATIWDNCLGDQPPVNIINVRQQDLSVFHCQFIFLQRQALQLITTDTCLCVLLLQGPRVYYRVDLPTTYLLGAVGGGGCGGAVILTHFNFDLGLSLQPNSFFLHIQLSSIFATTYLHFLYPGRYGGPQYQPTPGVR